jgi:hypothetical protein
MSGNKEHQTKNKFGWTNDAAAEAAVAAYLRKLEQRTQRDSKKK